jgi:PAS domain S-box-containing protein
MSGNEAEDFSQLLQELGALLWEAHGQQWRVIFLSDQVKKQLGFSGGLWNRDLTTWFDFLHPEDRDMTREMVLRARQSSETMQFENRIRASDGSWIWLRNVIKASPREADDAPRLQGIAFDISQLKVAQQALAEADRRSAFLANAGRILATSLDYRKTLRNIVDVSVPEIADWCAIRIATPDGELEPNITIESDAPLAREVETINRNFRPILNFGPRKVMSTGEPDFLPDSQAMADLAGDSPEHVNALRKLGFRSYICVPMRTPERVVGAVSLAITRPGRHYTKADLQVAEKLASRAALAIENAQLYRAQTRLIESERSARQELERAGRMKDDFLSTLSHELRAPLNAILGWTHLLGRKFSATPEKLAEGLAVIDRNVHLQVQMVDDLLDMSRIVSGKLRIDVQELDPREVILDAITSIQPAADARNIRIQSVLDPLTGPIRGDRNRLQQVVWNLLSNAIKFTPKGGRVQVFLERIESHIEITVSDTGQGIAPEFLYRVFDRFTQADASITRRHGGLGLGLAIVKHLTELHGGSVRVKSPGEGMGATFIIELPTPIAHPPRDDGPREHPRTLSEPEQTEFSSLTGISILAVDDEADARQIIKLVLEEHGAIVDTAASGAEGLELLKQRRYNVILSDIGMPDEDGYTFIRKVRELGIDRGGNTPAAALTAFARTDDRTRIFRAGYQMHIAKPVEPVELVASVTTLADISGAKITRI